jgi:FAD/FMN-containing dehydrogenase
MTSRIQPAGIKELSTVHENFVHPIEELFNIWNGDNPDVIGGYNETTKCIQNFLAEAIEKNKTVRALGGNWSWTKVGFTKDWMVSTTRLNRMKRLLPTEVETAYSFVPDGLLFCQCGCSVQEISRILRSLGRSLPTSGASNGQTIAGVISNCTHGSAIDFGSTPDFVAGLHLIVGPDKHVYLERKSKPIVSDVFINKIGAELLRDDDLFNAALVSFGSFGFIHGVMIETEPLYLLNVYRQRITYDVVKPLFESLDFTNSSFLPKPGLRPFHFQAIINPYDMNAGPYITTMYKETYREDYPRLVPDLNKAGPGDDAATTLGKVTTMLPVLTPLIVNQTIKSSYTMLHDVWGTHGEIFSTALAQGKVQSTAIGVPVEYTNKVLDIAFDINGDTSFVGVFALRFVKQTNATLGFTQYPYTCVAEFDSFEAPSTWHFYQGLWNALEQEGIPYTFHWGKVNNLNATNLRRMYGNKIDEWIKARNQILSADMLKVFTNQFMIDLELDAVIAPFV